MEVGSVAGDWKCWEELGRGNFGLVTLWRNFVNGERRAIKQFEFFGHRDPATVRAVESRWRNEVDMMLNQVESPYIVSALPVPEALRSGPERLLLCMEFCAGGDLRQVLRQPENAAGLPEREVRKVLASIGGAIAYLHSINIIHRDLKPENILRTSPTEDGVYKLGDLGFAKGLLENDSLSSTVLGTVQYLAPEIFVGKPYDITADYWSFGIIAFEICCGMRPFLHGQPPAIWIPCAEKKDEEVIAIHERADGRRILSKKFPYNTQLSERLKQCLEMWLKMMLQVDPKKRGRRLGGAESSNGGNLNGNGANSNFGANSSGNSKSGTDIIALGVLRTILQMEMLDIFCPAKRLSFAVGNSTTVSDVSGWIERDIGVKRDDQILVRSDGRRLMPHDAPLCMMRSDPNLVWFMIPKTYEPLPLVKPKWISELDACAQGDRACAWLERPLWAALISYHGNQLLQLRMLEQATAALRLQKKALLAQKVNGEVGALGQRLERMRGILFMEEELCRVETSFAQNSGDNHNETDQWKDVFCDIGNAFTKQKEILKTLLDSEAQSNTQPEVTYTYIKSLEQINSRILECFTAWRSGGESINSCAVQYIDNFQSIQRLHFVDHFRSLRNELSCYQMLSVFLTALEAVSKRLEDLKSGLLSARIRKQRFLLNVCYHDDTFLPPLPTAAFAEDGNEDEGIETLMQESILLESEVGEVLKRSMEGAEEIRGSRQKLDWSFLESFDN